MIVVKYLNWCKSAPTKEREKAVRALVRCYLEGKFSLQESLAVEATLSFIVEDPSPNVRITLAKEISRADNIQRSVILELANDQIEVASHIICFSPVLTDVDLVDLVGHKQRDRDRLVAMRRNLTVGVSAAIVEVGSKLAISDLLENKTSRITTSTYFRIIEKHGSCLEIRDLILARPDVVSDVRHILMTKTNDIFQKSPFLSNLLGKERLVSTLNDACSRATHEMVHDISQEDLPYFAQYLCDANALTPQFLMQTLCVGNLDLFAEVIAVLSDKGIARIRAILMDGRKHVISSLYATCGLSSSDAPLFASATILWRNAAGGGIEMNAAAVFERLNFHYGRIAETNDSVRDLLRIVENEKMVFEKMRARQNVVELTQLDMLAA